MARVILQKNEYLQINTVADKFLFQNNDNGIVSLIKTTNKPADDAAPTFKLKQFDAMSSSLLNGIFWGKASNSDYAIGLEEG